MSVGACGAGYGTVRLALVALLLLAATLPTAVASDDLDPARVAWTQLSYRGKKLMFSIDTDIGIEILPSASVGNSLVETTLGKGIEPSDSLKTVLLTLAFDGLGRQSLTRVWIGADSGVALQRVSRSQKKSRLRRKTLRFAETGVHLFFHRPAAGEDEARPETWTGGTDRFEAYPEWAGSDLQVTESTALFYLLSVANLSASGDTFQFPVISNDHLILVELTLVRYESIKVDYIRESGGQEVRVRGSVPALKILVSGHDLDPGSSESGLEFIGLKGDIAIYLDPETRAPLQVSGRAPYVGMAHVKIKRVVLK